VNCLRPSSKQSELLRRPCSRSFSPSTAIHAESPLPCITVVGLSPGIRPVGAGLCPPTWVAGANSSATEVSPEPTPAGHRDGSTWGRDATGPEPTPAPRWSRPPQTKPHAPNPSPQPSHKLVWDGSLLRLAGEGLMLITPRSLPLLRTYSRVLSPFHRDLAAASVRRGVRQAFRSYRRFFK
jgi:hypothetical protein